ncbi:uncharacterized protein LOC108652104 [Drosophila navojoa]|uniref:uncharacterized protein LOC108652104 n=1 Tax=Drosophila navojoa TaxID=7232 RepID=UPI0011BFB3FA|nr:uncharacterized protein LOC108652104 [Drosophila navojoa]
MERLSRISRMLIKSIALLLLFHRAVLAVSTACPLEQSCGKANDSSAICRLDEQTMCIRKYASKCHMDIAACREGANYTDFSDVYCQMETYLCEETATYERWTIFFGHSKD